MICVALKGPTPDEMIAKASRAVAAGAGMLEYRIDSLRDPSPESLRKLSAVGAIKIATLKGRSLKLVERADAPELFSSFEYVDMEMEDAGRVKFPERMRSKLVVSHHGPLRSSDELNAIVRTELESGAIAKCVGTLGNFAEASILATPEAVSEPHRVMAFSTGPAGLLTRLASLRNGAPWTYASLSDEERTADGQPVFSDLLEMHNGLVNVLIGADVSHSPSPLIQNYALARNRIRGRYVALSIGSREELEPFFRCARAAGVRGVNITMPYKTDAMALMSEIDVQASRIGAINTVVIDGERMRGYNTDYAAVRQLIGSLPHRRALVIGSGGAARSAVAALNHSDITVISRNAARSRAMALSMGIENGTFVAGSSYDIVINATPVGMDGRQGGLPEGVASCTFGTVMDFVYSKKKTPYRLLAEDQSCRYIGGAEILAKQAAESFNLWTGTDAPLEDMLSILRKEGFN
ncbi:MAG: type I 3-dehydroquinate dehydratase [Methanomassiliicoccales archaeon]|nr:type I 3-dehydroquinate dehydratase [Methanomassiliicoccales archaeon]